MQMYPKVPRAGQQQYFLTKDSKKCLMIFIPEMTLFHWVFATAASCSAFSAGSPGRGLSQKGSQDLSVTYQVVSSPAGQQ